MPIDQSNRHVLSAAAQLSRKCDGAVSAIALLVPREVFAYCAGLARMVPSL